MRDTMRPHFLPPIGWYWTARERRHVHNVATRDFMRGNAVGFHTLKWVTQLMHLFLCALLIDSCTWMHHWFHESFSSYRDILMGNTWSDGSTEGHFGMMIVLPPFCWPLTSWLIERKAEANSAMILRNYDLTTKQMNDIWVLGQILYNQRSIFSSA